jgi:hypothetical protein
MLFDWFGGDKDGFVVIADLARICLAMGFRNAGTHVGPIMRLMRFEQKTPYLFGAKAKCWVRDDSGMLPRHIAEKLPRFIADEQNKRFVLRGGQAGGAAPPGLPPPPVPTR